MKEFEKLWTDETTVSGVHVAAGSSTRPDPLQSASLDCELEAVVPRGASLEFRVATMNGHFSFGIDNGKQTLFIDRTACGVEDPKSYAQRYDMKIAFEDGQRVALRILFDRCVLEMFADSGQTTMSAFVLPQLDPVLVEVGAVGGDCEIERMAVRQVAGF